MSNWVDGTGMEYKSDVKRDLMESIMDWVKTSRALNVGMLEQDGETFYVAFFADGEDDGVDFETQEGFEQYIMEFAADGFVWVTDNEPFESYKIEWTNTFHGEIYGSVRGVTGFAKGKR